MSRVSMAKISGIAALHAMSEALPETDLKRPPQLQTRPTFSRGYMVADFKQSSEHASLDCTDTIVSMNWSMSLHLSEHRLGPASRVLFRP